MLAQLKKHLTPHELWEDAKFFFLLNLGLIATAVGIAVFKTPNHFAFGGTSGLSIVLATLFPRFNVGAFMWFVNAALVLLGFVFLGIKSMGWTIYSSFALSFYVSLCERLYPLDHPLTSDVFLELCFAVILPALGAAVVFNIGASTGGTDIIAMILHKYTSLEIGRALLVSDIGIVLWAAYLYGPATGLYCILGMILKSTVVDNAIELTAGEFTLLQLFLKHPGRVFTRDQLLERIWSTDYVGETRTVDVHIGTLRTKLGQCGEYIRTVRGVGYRMEA